MTKKITPNILEHLEVIIGKIQSVSYPEEQGATSEVSFLHTDNEGFVCKIARKTKYRAWLSKEAKVMKIINDETNLPIPTFFQFIEDKKESYLLMSLEEGITLREALQNSESDEERYKLLLSFGELLKQLHETNQPALWTTEENWLDNQLEEATYNLHTYQVDGDQKLLNKLKQHRPIPSKQTLIHGDCTIDNVLVSQGRVQTFIDLAGVAYGDPRYDIALAIRSIEKDEAMLSAFYKGYCLQIITKEEFDYFDGGLYEFF